MDLKKIYGDITVLCKREIAIYDFLLYIDMCARTLLAKYPKKIIIPVGEYMPPSDLSGELAFAGEFYLAILLFVAAKATCDVATAEQADAAAEDAYINLWKKNAAGKRMKGDVW